MAHRTLLALLGSLAICLQLEVACACGAETVFEDLNGVARRPLDPDGKLASVLIFYGHDCPISNGYAPELNRISASHTNFDFYIVQVDPHLSRADAAKHANDYNLRITVLLDPEHQLVKLAGATIMPEAVVFDKSGRRLYRGRIDNLYASLGKKRSQATQHDLIDALDAITAGKHIKTRETKAIGCIIP